LAVSDSRSLACACCCSTAAAAVAPTPTLQELPGLLAVRLSSAASAAAMSPATRPARAEQQTAICH
jgi:hypothetical protein